MAQTIGTAYVKVLPDPRGLSEFHSRVQKSIGSIKLNVDQSKGAFAPLGKISADLNQFQNSLDASVARTLAFGASVGVIGGTVRSIKAVIDSFIEVEKSIADINAVFKLTTPELKGFTAGLFDVARDTSQSFKDVATAATEFSRQGLSAGETLKRTESAMKLVRLAGLETTQAVNVLTAAMNGFSSAGLESQEIVNKLATVDAAYAVSSSDLALALSRAGDTAQGAKVSFDELLGAVTAVQQRTARGGAVIGNGLKSILTRVQRSRVQEALEDVGVATKDADGNIRESMLVLKDYAMIYDTLSDSQRAFTDEQIAGVYQINTLKALVRDMANEYGVYNGAVHTSTEATDEAEKRMAALSQTTDAKLKRISTSFAEFSSLGGKDVFGPVISRLDKGAEGVLGFVNSKLKEENKGFLGSLFSGAAQGLGNFLAGPGLFAGLNTAVRLVKFLGKEAITAAAQVSQINSESQKRLQSQQAILGLLQNDSALVAQITSGTINAANANRLIETSLAKQLLYSERIAAFQKNVGAFVASNPAIIASHAAQLGGKARRFAGGYAPTIRKEKNAIAQGVGGARSGDKPVVIPEFNYGGGKRGPAVAHTGEWFVPHFNGGSAIFNRDMAESYGLPSGAVRVGMAKGYAQGFPTQQVPIDGRETRRLLREYYSGMTKYELRDRGMREHLFRSAQEQNRRDTALRMFGPPTPATPRMSLPRIVLPHMPLLDSARAPSSTPSNDERINKKLKYVKALRPSKNMRRYETENGSYLDHRFVSDEDGGEEYVKIDYMKSRKKGDARAMFERLGESVKRLQGIRRKQRPNDPHFELGVVSSEWVAQAGVDASLQERFKQARYRQGISKRTEGTIGGDYPSQRKRFNDLDELEELYNERRGKPTYVYDIVDYFSKGYALPSNGHIPHFIDFRSSTPSKVKSKSGFRMQYLLGDKVPKGSSAIVDQLRSDPYIAQIDKTFKSLGLPEPKAGIRDFLLDTNREGKLFSSTGGVYYPKTGASIVGQRGADATDFIGILGHEVGGHHLDATFQNSPAAKQKGIGGYISDDPRFVSKFKRVYGAWKSKGPEAKISPVLKRIFSRIEESGDIYSGQKALRREVFADISQYLYGRGSNKLTMRTGIGKFINSITGATSFASGYDPLGQAVSRESDAVGSSKVRVGTHPSLKAPHNPMGIGVYNSSEGSLANGIRMARAAGIEPKTKGMADGHVPNFAQMRDPKTGRFIGSATESPYVSPIPNLRTGSAPPISEITHEVQSLIDTLSGTAGSVKSLSSNVKTLGSTSTSSAASVTTLRLKSKPIVEDSRAFGTSFNQLQNEYQRENSKEAFQQRMQQVLYGHSHHTLLDDPTDSINPLVAGGSGVTSSGKVDRNVIFGNRVGPGEAAFVRSTNLSNLNMRGVDAPNGIGSQLRGIGRRAFSYTPEEQARGKGQGRFMQAFGAQIAGGIIRSMGEGTKRERETAAFSSGLDAAATALTLIPGPAGAVAAGLAGVGTAAYQWFSSFNDQVGPLRKSLEEQAMAANKSAQALSDATQAYSAYESAMKSSDPARMSIALNKLTDKIFAIGNADHEAMQQALGAIGSSNPQEAFANAQEIIAKRQAAIERNIQLVEGAQKAGGIKNSLIRDLIKPAEGVSSEELLSTIREAQSLAASGNLESAIDKLGEKLEGGRATADAAMKGAYGKGIGGTITDPEKKQGVQRLSDILIDKTRNLGNLEDFKKAIEAPAKEVSASQLRLAKVSRDFGMELERASGALSFLSYSVEKGFKDQMEFRDNSFKSALEALQATEDISERRALELTGRRNENNISLEDRMRRRGLQSSLAGSGPAWANQYIKLDNTTQAGSAAINDVFSKAGAIVGNEKLAPDDAVRQMQELFSPSALKDLQLGDGDDVAKLLVDLSAEGSKSILELQKIGLDTSEARRQNQEQIGHLKDIYNINSFLKTMWGKGATQKGTTEVNEATVRIDMAMAKANMTISEREQLAVDLAAKKGQNPEAFKASGYSVLDDFNTRSLNAALRREQGNRNTNYLGALPTPSTNEEVYAERKRLADKLANQKNSESEFLLADQQSEIDYEASRAKMRGKGGAADPEKPFDWTKINKGFADMATETGKIAIAFRELEKVTIATKDAQINLSIAANDEAARQAKYDAIDQSERQYKQKKDELVTKINEGTVGKTGDGRSVLTVAGREATDTLAKLEETRKNEESTRFAAAMTNLEALLKKMHDKMTDPASEGSTDVTRSEIAANIKLELAANALSDELRRALKAAFAAESEEVLKDLLTKGLKEQFNMAKP